MINHRIIELKNLVYVFKVKNKYFGEKGIWSKLSNIETQPQLSDQYNSKIYTWETVNKLRADNN